MDITFVIMFCVAMVAGEQQGDNTGDVFLLYTDYIKGTVGTMSMDGSQRDNCLPSRTFSYPSGITYDQNSNTVYLVEKWKNVHKFMLDGQSSPELIYQNTSGYLYALAFDGEGHIFITDLINDKITRINVNGTDPVDWVTGVDASWSVVADTTDRHLIWTDYNAHTISRTSLDDPLSTVTVIIQNTRHPTGLHIDTQLGKLFWCESGVQVLTANTDGSDAEVIVDIALSYLRGITSYGGHLYVTDTSSPYTVYDIYNGSYTAIFNSTTSKPYSITIVNNHIPATVCKVNCYNGGTLVEANRICDCVHPWTGRECTDCDITCQNGGTLDTDTCTCNCFPQWSGSQCENCGITCQNGGTLDADTCTCDCLPQWSGDQCENCITRCQNGGTLDVNKCTCNCLPKWSGDRCHTCDITCQNGGTLYADTCTCDCSTQWNGDQCKILQLPTPGKNSPEIISSSPGFGPVAGGTWITVTGNNFPLEYNMFITIADQPCDTKLQNTTTVIGITEDLPENDTDLIERPLPVSLKANSAVIVDSEYAFTYKKNPVISKVFPTESIIKGGTLLTVDGDNLDSVAVIWMEVSMILKTLKSDEPLVYDETRTTYATKCQEANSTRMFCPTPVLDVPSGFVNQIPQSKQTKRDVYRYMNIGKANKVRSLGMEHFLSANPSSRIKRETVKLEFSNDGDILEFYIGFRLDGVREYENYTAIDIYTEPTFDFQSSTVMIFKAGERLSFNCQGCDIGITINDYRVNIGKEDCADLELWSNSLSCYPPQSKPAMDEDESNTEDPQIIIHVGLNLKHFAGYLRYPDPDRTATFKKLPLHIIIPATVVPAIVIIIVIAAVCATQRRRACCQRHE